MNICTLDDCPSPVKGHGYCNKHYQRWKATGDPLVVRKRHSPNGSTHAFAEEVIASSTDECILWPYAIAKAGGYGVMTHPETGRQVKAHRYICEAVHGPAEGRLAVHGPCHQPACVNPRHLSWGTPAQNADDRRRDGTHLEGSAHPRARLTDDEVEAIRSEYARGGVLQRELAERYGCTQQQVSNLVHGRRSA